MRILVTGAAGFIGSRLLSALAERGDEVVGVDNLNDYYDVRLKIGRLAECGFTDRASIESGRRITSGRFSGCSFVKMDISDKPSLDTLFETAAFEVVVNLAAQAGVRYSISNPYAYLQSNLAGFLNILEGCRNYNVKHLVYASSSSVYGLNSKVPYSESDPVDRPVSLYAATKKSNELMAHSYCDLYRFACTGLRFFTVYGPWGRPDMSPMLFASSIMRGEPIRVFNNGDMIRDFTYIDDIVEGTIGCIDRIPEVNENGLRYRVYNIGCSHPVKLMDFISEMERALGMQSEKIFLPMQPGDVYQTNADTTLLEREVGYKPHVRLREGMEKFVSWYLSDKNPLRYYALRREVQGNL